MTTVLDFTAEDRAAAELVAAEIDAHLTGISAKAIELERDFARLGSLLHQVRERKFWRIWGFETFGKYIVDVGLKVRLRRTQMYEYIGAAESLLPLLPEEQVVHMGIAKAIELTRSVKRTGTLKQEVVDKALDEGVSRDELRATIFESEHIKPDHPNMQYRDLHGFYATADEWGEFTDAFELACVTDPVIPKDIPGWARTKEVMLRFAREYQSTYAAQETA